MIRNLRSLVRTLLLHSRSSFSAFCFAFVALSPSWPPTLVLSSAPSFLDQVEVQLLDVPGRRDLLASCSSQCNDCCSEQIESQSCSEEVHYICVRLPGLGGSPLSKSFNKMLSLRSHPTRCRKNYWGEGCTLYLQDPLVVLVLLLFFVRLVHFIN